MPMGIYGNQKGVVYMNKKWLKCAGIRAIKTMAQTSVSMLTVGQAVMDVNWVNVLSVSVVAGIISILTSVAGLPEVEQLGFRDTSLMAITSRHNKGVAKLLSLFI